MEEEILNLLNIVHTSSFAYIWRLEEFHNAIQIHYSSIFKTIQRSIHIFWCNRLKRHDKIREQKKKYSNIHPKFCLLTPSTLRYVLFHLKKSKGYLFLSIFFTLDSLKIYRYIYIFTGNKAHKTYFHFFL